MLEINRKGGRLAEILPILLTYGIHYSLIIGAFPLNVHLEITFVANSIKINS